MMKNYVYLLFLIAFIALGCNQTDQSANNEKQELSEVDTKLLERVSQFIKPLPEIALNPQNEITKAKVELGKALYFDTRLSSNNSISCNTCHNLSTYGVDNNPLSFGVNGTLGTRNSPTVLNAALHISQFWDGREPDVEAQAKGPILNPVEMAIHDSMIVVDRIMKIPTYKAMFTEAFGDGEITYDNIANAIGAFERTLLTPSRFDDFLAGNGNALTDVEKKGMETFLDAGCTVCHVGPAIGGTMYQKFGLVKPAYWEYTKSDKIDNGRFDATGKENDKYFFKVPGLRNIMHTYPYFHDGSIWDINEAVKIMALVELGKELNDEEINSIVDFLEVLTGTIPKDALELPILPILAEEII